MRFENNTAAQLSEDQIIQELQAVLGKLAPIKLRLTPDKTQIAELEVAETWQEGTTGNYVEKTLSEQAGNRNLHDAKPCTSGQR